MLKSVSLLRHQSLQIFRRPREIRALEDILHFQRRRCSDPTNLQAPGSKADSHPDHRTIGTTQELFITSPHSPGAPIFLPHGTHIYNKLIEFLRAQYAIYGFKEVLSPNIYKRTLWELSGHWENYKNDMFEVTGRSGAALNGEGNPDDSEQYALKPMNCPGHCLIFKATAGSRSFRDLPVRLADFSPLHRNENSGSLSGLTRVRRFHQDDGHIFCRPIQIAQEISSTLNFIQMVYKVFDLPCPVFVLSTRPECFIGSIEEWTLAEESLRRALDSSGEPWSVNEGGGAFYGPKIDVTLTDSDGKQHQTATIQLDFQLGRRFGLKYLAPAPSFEKKGLLTDDPEELKTSGYVTPVIIHRAVFGSLERFMALLIEHYKGKWPFWLSPRQAIVIPVAMTDKIIKYARVAQCVISGVALTEHQIRPLPLSRRKFIVDIDQSSNSLAKKIKEARKRGYNHIMVVGERNVDEGNVTIEMKSKSREDLEETSLKAGSSFTKYQSVNITPQEVYRYFEGLEDTYI